MYQRELDWPAYRSKSWQHPCCCSRFTSTTHVAVLAASVSPRATTDAQFAIHDLTRFSSTCGLCCGQWL